MRGTKSQGWAAGAAILLLALTGCGSSGDQVDDNGGDTSAPDTPSPTSETTTGAASSDDPIRIGALTSFTGPFTPWGLQNRAGMQLAVDEINADGGVDGRTLELVEGDDQGNPEEATNVFERMIEQDGIVAAGGIISSDVGLASSRVAEEMEVPLFLNKAGAANVLTADSRYTFRTCLPAAPMTAQPLAQYIEENDLTRVGAIVADYAYGQSVREALEASVGQLEGVELQVEVAPVTETDFTTYLRQLDGFEPDLIAASGHPPGAASILLQAVDLGFDVPVTGPYSGLGLEVENVGEVAYDRYADLGCVDFASEEYQDLAARFAESTEFEFMQDHAVAGYGMVQMVAEAVAEVGDDPVAVAEYLHGNEFEIPGYAFTVSWTEWGELAEAQPAFAIIRQQTPPEGINEGRDWYPEVLLISEPLEPYEP